MKFAFIIMGDFNLKYDHAAIHQQTAQIIGVTNLAEASIVAKNYLLRKTKGRETFFVICYPNIAKRLEKTAQTPLIGAHILTKLL